MTTIYDSKTFIPVQLHSPDFRFALLHPKGEVLGNGEKSNGKSPKTKWTTDPLAITDARLLNDLKNQRSYAVITGHGGLAVVDIDHASGLSLMDRLPETFTVLSGGKKLPHLYYRLTGDSRTNKKLNFRVPLTDGQVEQWVQRVLAEGYQVLNELRLENLCDLQAGNALVVGPNSRLDESTVYEVNKDIPITEIEYSELVNIIRHVGISVSEQKQRIVRMAKQLSPLPQPNANSASGSAGENGDAPYESELWKEIEALVTVPMVCEHFGEHVDPSSNKRYPCPLGHSSQSKADVWYGTDRWYCHSCNQGGGAFRLFHLRSGERTSDGKSKWSDNSIAFAGLAGGDWQERWEKYLADRKQSFKTKESSKMKNATSRIQDEEATLSEINKNYFWVEIPESSPIMRENIDADGRYSIESIQTPHFRGYFANQTIHREYTDATGKTRSKSVPAGDAWITWPQRRTYTGLTFYPGELPPESAGYFNTWKGYHVTPVKGAFPMIEKHFREIWCRGNDAYYTYLIAFFAQLLQEPHKKMGSALVVKGVKGAGKSIILHKIFEPILKDCYIKLDKQDQVTGKFNKHLRNKLLILQEEAVWPGDKAIEGTLKSMITDELTIIEAKGVDCRPERFFARFVFFSNEKFVVPSGFGERRFFALEVDGRVANDLEYFNTLAEAIDAGEREAFMHYLMHFDHRAVNLRQAIRTPYLLDDIASSLGAHEKWLWHILDDPHSIDGFYQERYDRHVDRLFFNYVKSSELADSFKAWVASSKEFNTYMSKSRFGDTAALAKFVKQFFNCRTGRRIDGVRTLFMPDILTARSIFEEKLGIRCDWICESPTTYIDPASEIDYALWGEEEEEAEVSPNDKNPHSALPKGNSEVEKIKLDPLTEIRLAQREEDMQEEDRPEQEANARLMLLRIADYEEDMLKQ